MELFQKLSDNLICIGLSFADKTLKCPAMPYIYMFLQLLWEEGVHGWAPDLKGFLEDWHEIAKFFRLTTVHVHVRRFEK